MGPAGAIKVLVADDHPMFREGVRATLAGVGAELVGEADDGHAAVRLADELKPDVVLMDLCLPRLDGFRATLEILRRAPGIRVILLSLRGDRELVLEALRCGARGFLTKSCRPGQLAKALSVLGSGTPFYAPHLGSRKALARLLAEAPKAPPRSATSLSERERQVLGLIALGLRSKEIARRLSVGVRTVEKHRENLGRKLGLRGAAALTKYAILQGYAGLDGNG